MRLNKTTSAGIAIIFALLGCSRFDAARAKDSAAPAVAATPGSTAVKPARPDTAITMTAAGFGPLRIGMTVANAAAALHSPVPSTVGLDTACAYVPIANAPVGMRVMVTGGTVARIEIDSSSIATGLGVRVGDSEARVHQLYGSRVTVQPHKYLPNGRYLIVAPIPASDSGLKLVFETDGNRVTKYRAGRTPEVEWVEGCA